MIKSEETKKKLKRKESSSSILKGDRDRDRDKKTTQHPANKKATANRAETTIIIIKT